MLIGMSEEFQRAQEGFSCIQESAMSFQGGVKAFQGVYGGFCDFWCFEGTLGDSTRFQERKVSMCFMTIQGVSGRFRRVQRPT